MRSTALSVAMSMLVAAGCFATPAPPTTSNTVSVPASSIGSQQAKAAPAKPGPSIKSHGSSTVSRSAPGATHAAKSAAKSEAKSGTKPAAKSGAGFAGKSGRISLPGSPRSMTTSASAASKGAGSTAFTRPGEKSPSIVVPGTSNSLTTGSPTNLRSPAGSSFTPAGTATSNTGAAGTPKQTPSSAKKHVDAHSSNKADAAAPGRAGKHAQAPVRAPAASSKRR